MKITLYTINDCPFCTQEKAYLSSHNVQFEEKNLETSKENLTEMLAVSNNFAGTPVTKVEKDDGSIAVLKGFTKEEFDQTLGFSQSPAQTVAPAVTVQQPPSPIPEPPKPPSPPPTPEPPVQPVVPPPTPQMPSAPPVVEPPQPPVAETPPSAPVVPDTKPPMSNVAPAETGVLQNVVNELAAQTAPVASGVTPAGGTTPVPEPPLPEPTVPPAPQPNPEPQQPSVPNAPAASDDKLNSVLQNLQSKAGNTMPSMPSIPEPHFN